MLKTSKASTAKIAFTQTELLQLLAINKAITEARNTSDLLAAIRQTVMELIPFYHTGILIVEKDGMHHYDMSVNFPGWDDSEANKRLQQQKHLLKIKHPNSYVAHIQQQLEIQSPTIENWELAMEQWDHPFFPFAGETGYKEGLVTELKFGGITYGSFWLNSIKKNQFKEDQFPLFQAISEQVSVAVANILANEEIQYENRTKAILLNISEYIAALNNRKELFAVIFNEIRAIIPVDDTAILVLNNEGTMWQDWTNIDKYQDSKAAANLNQAGFTEYIEMDSSMKVSFADTGIRTIDDYLKDCHPFAPIMAEAGLKEFMFTPLIAHGKTIGSLFFDSKKYGTYSAAYFNTFRSIANMVASAVSNILANEEIREREKEKTILLSISEAVATIRDKKELLKFVFEKVKPLFGFYDAGFFVFSRDKEFIEDWTVAMPETSPSVANYKIASNHASSFLFPASGLETFYKQLKESKGPAIAYYNEELFAQYPDYPQWEAIREIGYKESIGTLLRADEGDLGILFFNSLTLNHFNRRQFSLFQGIADQLATAVANILANEEILEREKEKDVLLNISQRLSSVKTTDELLQIIIRQVQPVFNFYDTGILLIDKETNGYYDLSVIHPNIDESEVNYYLHDKGYYRNQVNDLANSGIEWMIQQFEKEIPLVFKYNMDHSAFSDHELLTELEKAGYNEAWACPLEQQGEIFGVLTLNYARDQQMQLEKKQLLLALTDRISSSLSNILANQEILKREKEKTLLLNISNSIAQINNKVDLLKSIDELLWPIFHHDDAGFSIVDKDGKFFTDYHILYSGEIPASEEAKYLNSVIYKEVYNVEDSTIPFPGSIVEHYMYRKPEMGKLENVLELEANAEILTLEIKHGIVYYICSPLTVGGKNLGLFNLLFKEENKPSPSFLGVFAQIAEIMALAFSNILANEEIIEREREKTILLELTELIAQVKNKNDLLKLIVDKIKPIFNFHDCGLFILSKNGLSHSDLAAVLPDVGSSEWNEKIAALSTDIPHKDSPVEWMIDTIENAHQPVLFDFVDLVEKFPRYPQIDGTGLLEMCYRDCLATNLKVGGKTIGMFCINALAKDFFPIQKFNILQSVGDTLAIAVANILANEEILEREQEKTQLLKISEAIASIQNYKELLKVIYEIIKPVFPFDNTGLFIFDRINEQLNEITHGDVLSGTIAESFAEAKVFGPFALKDFRKSSWYFSAVPVITTLSKEVKLINDVICKQQMTISMKSGLRQMICGPLLTGGKKIGAIYLSTKEADLYNDTHIHLFKSVTNLIAIAVANILANQEIVEREREKSLLLEINDAVVLIKDKASLFHLMMQKLQPFAGFDDAVLVMLSKDGNYCNGMIEAVEIVGPGYAKFNGLIPLSTAIGNSPADFLRKQPDLYMWDLDEMETLYPNHPYLGMMRQKELRYSVYLKVNWDVNNQVGFLNFHFKEKEGIQNKYFNLYKNIAYQLAASLSNIIAQEEIENKAKEIVNLNKQLEAQNTYLVEEVEQQYNFEEMIGQNAQFAQVCRNIGLVAKTDSSVLILGETGTGKELVARAIHNNSTRKNKPLIKLNCAALPATLIESELFGHERGAFTGAIERRIGKFELANGSTLFLDEVGELPLELQSKLLRALQEREIERLGSNKTLQVDVRIIAATNRELEKEVQAGKFRQDLYYRLHIFPIPLPALRERKEDLPLLAAHFIERYAKKIGKKIQGLNNKAVQEMMGYNWPGNIRELEHVIERSVILAKSQLIQDLNLPVSSKKRITTSPTEFVIKPWEEQERDYILEVLKLTKGNMAGKGGAAELLQLPPTTLQSKMNKLGIKRRHFLETKESEK